MNFFNKLFGNNKEETPDEKDGVLSVSKKAILKKVPLRWKLIAIYVTASIFGIMILVTLLVALFKLEAVNSTEVAGSKRYDSNTSNAYEQSVIEFQENNNITEYVDNNNKAKTGHEAYYDALFKAYEQYKSVNNGRPNIFENILNFFKGIFQPRSSIKAPVKDNQSKDELDKPYGVQIDTSLITTTLYSSRFYGDMILNEEMQENKNSDNYINFYLDASEYEYYDLHSTNFRDKVEVDYFEQARKDEDSGEKRDVTKLAIEGIEILSKYMIQRVETYYTLNKNFVNVDYDTTRHIKIVHKFNMSDACYEYVNVEEEPELKYKRSTGGKYSWNDGLANTDEKREVLENCKKTYSLKIYDNAEYNTKGKDKYKNQYSEGYDEFSYELDCYGYKEYLLGNYPTAEDKALFCENGDCYSDNFISSYYHNYVPNDGEDKQRKIEDIVNEIYSVLEYYENSTMNYNVCSNNYNDSYYYDMSCGNGGYASGDCSFNGVTINVTDEKGNVIKSMGMQEYIIGNAYGEIGYSSNENYVKTQMIAAKTHLLVKGKYNSQKTSITVEAANRHQLWLDVDATTYREAHRYTNGKNYNYYYPDWYRVTNDRYKGPMTSEQKARYTEIYNSIANYILIREELATIPVNWNNDSYKAEYTNTNHKKWASLSKDGMAFNDILANTWSSLKLVECGLSADNSYQIGSGLTGPSINTSVDRCTGYVDDSTFNYVLAADIIKYSLSLIGRPYVRGDEFAAGQAGGDCSGLTTYVYNKVGVSLPRSSANSQFNKYKNVCVKQMKTGDILFWADGGGSTITHTGIYIGAITYGGKTYTNAIVDASSKNQKVVIRELWGNQSGSSYPLIAVARPYAK